MPWKHTESHNQFSAGLSEEKWFTLRHFAMEDPVFQILEFPDVKPKIN